MPSKIIKTFFLIASALAVASLWLIFLSKPANKSETGTADFSNEKAPAAAQAPRVREEGDIEFQKPLADPPEEVKAVYATGESAGNPEKIDVLVKLIKKAGLNAMVIDIKDYTGYVFYDSGIEDVARYKAEKIKIPKINSLIKKLHDENIYAIARIVVFQDSVLASARPELAVKNRISGRAWKDNRGLAWIDPASKESWDYIIKIARDASARGFDEINFDYIRFPSDGSLDAMDFPFYDPKTSSKSETMKEFFSNLRSGLRGIKISADLFGLTTVAKGDLGIGQAIEGAYQNFDYVSPMVYPSHYAAGFMGFQEPAMHPYEVVKYSIEGAAKKLAEYKNAEESGGVKNEAGSEAKIRPWIQAFNMGGVYDAAKIKIQIKASDEAGGTGWMLWNSANNYSFLNNF